MDQEEKDKKSGLQKKISSIFQGMPDLGENTTNTPHPDPPPQGVREQGLKGLSQGEREQENGSLHLPQGVRENIGSTLPHGAEEPYSSAGNANAGNASVEFLKQIRKEADQIRPCEDFASPEIKLGAASSRIGLDFGSRQCKLVRLGPKDKLEAIALRENGSFDALPHLASPSARGGLTYKGEGSIEEEALRDMALNAGAAKVTTVLGLRSDAVSYHVLKFPPLSRNELSKAVRWELSKKGPPQSSASLVDYRLLRSTQAEKKILVLAMSAREASVQEQLEQAQEAGFMVDQVGTTVQALENVVKKANLFRPNEDGAILEIGHGTSVLCFFKGTDLQYVRTIGVGAKDFLGAMTGVLSADGQSFDLGVEEAVALQRQVGIPTDDMLKSHPAKALLWQISARLRPVLEDIVGEFRGSMEFYLNTSGSGPVDRLYLSGGAAAMKGTDSYLARELGLDVQLLMPLDAMGMNVTETWRAIQSTFTVALGLALGDRHRLALMPEAYRLRTLDKTVTRYAKLVATVSIAGMLCAGAGLTFFQTVLNKKLDACAQRYAALSGPAQACTRILEIQKTIQQREQMIAGSALRQPLWEGIFKEIGSAIPDNVVLTQLSLVPHSVPKSLKLVGAIYADNLSADSQLSTFMDRMVLGPYLLSFDLASRKNIPTAQTPASTFEIHGVLEY